jgi:hypothetical protein
MIKMCAFVISESVLLVKVVALAISLFFFLQLNASRIRQPSSSLKRKIVWAEGQIRATQGGNLDLWGPERFFSGCNDYLIYLSVISKSHLFVPIGFIRLSLVSPNHNRVFPPQSSLRRHSGMNFFRGRAALISRASKDS